MNTYKKKVVIVFILISFLVLPLAASAQLDPNKLDTSPLEETGLSESFLGCTTTSEATCIVENILKFILAFAFLAAVVEIIISGYRMLVSGGNEEAVTAAKKNLYWAIAGIIVIALSWAILTFVIKIVTTGNPAGGGSGTPSESSGPEKAGPVKPPKPPTFPTLPDGSSGPLPI